MKFILSPVYLVSLLALTHAADADDFSLRGTSNYPDLAGGVECNSSNPACPCFLRCMPVAECKATCQPPPPTCHGKCMFEYARYKYFLGGRDLDSYCREKKCKGQPEYDPSTCQGKCMNHWKPFAATLDNLGHTPETWCKLLCDQNADYDPTNPPGKTDVAES